jgi:hypothetical protein
MAGLMGCATGTPRVTLARAATVETIRAFPAGNFCGITVTDLGGCSVGAVWVQCGCSVGVGAVWAQYGRSMGAVCNVGYFLALFCHTVSLPPSSCPPAHCPPLRNGSSLTKWFTDYYIGGKEYGLGNEAVDGFYLDDSWSDAPSEEEWPCSKRGTGAGKCAGFSKKVRIQLHWRIQSDTHSLTRSRSYPCPSFCSPTPLLLAPPPSACPPLLLAPPICLPCLLASAPLAGLRRYETGLVGQHARSADRYSAVRRCIVGIVHVFILSCSMEARSTQTVTQ